jgi:3-hydroxybutyryl-CoA dehydrogenase
MDGVISRTIAVIGCGLMGTGIARVLVGAGHDVIVVDADVARARDVAQAVSARSSPTVESAVEHAELIFEAIAEDEEAKRDLFARIGRAAPNAVVASNTSSILPSRLASALPTPERFAIAHFFNPAEVVPLVEIVPAPQTSPATLTLIADVLRGAGKQPVLLARETPGFVANRLQAALLREAFALEREGIVSFAELDLIVRAGLGARWAAAGPFGVVDLGGLDIWRAVCERLFPHLDVDTVAPEALRSRVESGTLGAKSGVGLYPHTPEGDSETRTRIAEHFAIEFRP